MNNPYDIIIKPVMSEKSYGGIQSKNTLLSWTKGLIKTDKKSHRRDF